MYVIVVGLRFVNAPYYLGKLGMADVQFAKPGIGAGEKCGNYHGVNVMCSPVTYVEIFYVPALLILFGDFAHGVNQGISGLLSLRNYSSEIVHNKYAP
jgi:hypothetical protein